MRNILVCILFLSKIVFAADLSVQPLYFEFQNKGKTKEVFSFDLKSNKAAKVNLSIYQAKQGITGKLNFIESNEQELITLRKNTMNFMREGSKKVFGTITYPKKQNRTLVYAIMVEEVKSAAQKGVGITVRYAVVLKVSTNHKRVFEKAKLTKFSFKKIDEKLIFQSLFENITLKDYFVNAYAVMRDENNKFVDKFKLKTLSSWQKKVDDSIVFPNSKVALTGAPSKKISKGKYKVTVVSTINGKRKIVKKMILTIDEQLASKTGKSLNRGLFINPIPMNIKMKKGKVGKYRIQLVNDNDHKVTVKFPKQYFKNSRRYYKFFPKTISLEKGAKKNAIFSIKNDLDVEWQLNPLKLKVHNLTGEKELSIPVKLIYNQEKRNE